ncbi:MAG: transcriptional repressor [Synechococcales cyanobacterium K44_A2020_017]|jgi:Fur family ferric uptake transcriptional regulator|uniref:Fur family transcriptional regulator n=1 Tax=Leptolyngbya sp. CCY15150 TaxID=2767772 RepID=UPI0019515743|nr:transcriptional repressor [Leptolyngbya sp. CCY15150]MBF2090211.1 transcriptional repressor [Synechococcales cyanobacterium K32_A2020_035]MBF2094466.1 transcriptional repressor [Synechococcales cyanobacterium K44_A2020_017]
MYTASSLKAELNHRGWRMTPQRETILQAFQNLAKGKHLSAEDLYNRLHAQGENISLATIYRTLKLMARMGILRELELAEGHKHYELNQPAPYHHHHLICVRCNQTIEFKNDSILRSGVKTADKNGYHLLDCQLTIHAICPACQRSLIPV